VQHYFLFFSILTYLCLSACSDGATSLKDKRDQQTYEIAQIGSQVWMKENLNYNSPQSFCYDNQTANCKTNGRFYNQIEALSACPKGWKLPSDSDWKILEKHLGIGEDRIDAFREWRTSQIFERSLSTLSVDLAGIVDNTGEDFKAKESVVRYWSNTDGPSTDQFAVYRMFMDSEKGIYTDQIPKKSYCCVRCIKQ